MDYLTTFSESIDKKMWLHECLDKRCLTLHNPSCQNVYNKTINRLMMLIFFATLTSLHDKWKSTTKSNHSKTKLFNHILWNRMNKVGLSAEPREMCMIMKHCLFFEVCYYSKHGGCLFQQQLDILFEICVLSTLMLYH